METTHIPQRSITPRADLREMLREYLIARFLGCMAQAAERREAAIVGSAFGDYQHATREAVLGFYGRLPAGEHQPPPIVTSVSRFEFDGFRVENVLFDTYPGWQVNASIFTPKQFKPPFPAVVVPVGHSGKQYDSYQLPCQYFARNGYLAITFDPPGQSGEKQPGNDHFIDGVRDYLLGETSSRYFVSDALRCIDYLATRPDVDLRHGVAMTGVSGGGTTTTFAALLDDRITVIGPSCCVTALADLDISQCYSGCPETHQWRRYADGVDEVDLLCAGAPKSCLLMAGEFDEVFHIADTRKLAAVVAQSYGHVGAADRFRFFVDKGGHAYSLTQAREFVRFMNRWLCNVPDREATDVHIDQYALVPYENLRCSPRTDVNMRTIAMSEADALANSWDRWPESIRDAAATVTGVKGLVTPPEAEVGEPFQVWTHDWRAVMIRPEPGIELPSTLLTSRASLPAPTVLHFDDAGRHRLLHRQGLLTNAIRFVDRDHVVYNLLTVDLRGWGDTAPAMYPYEMPGWGGIDRYLAYGSAALGDPILGMRIRDALRALAWLRTRREVDPARIVLTGCGLGCIVALHVAAIDRGAVAGVVGWDGLSSFRSLMEAEHYPWSADAFLPRVLRYYDLPELAAATISPVLLYGLRDGAGNPVDGEELTRYQATNVRVSAVSDIKIINGIQALLTGTLAA